MKYAVIKTGGKQYKVSEGDVLEVEKLELEKEKSFNFTEVLLLVNEKEILIGSPLIKGANVKANVLDTYKGKKIHGLKYRSSANFRKRYGHRQWLTRVKIEKISSAKQEKE